MLRFVDTATQSIDPYVELVPAEQLAHVRELARELRGARILQLNATPYGGGVAELLNSLVPLKKGLGLDVTWGVIVAEPAFFALTKRLHNALQGAPSFDAPKDELAAYLSHNQHVADAIRGKYDIVIVHDPQPAPVQHLAHDGHTRWIWRVHIDLSAYNREAWQFLDEYVHAYDAFVFTMPEFVPEPLDRSRVRCFAPAIDPLSPKNMPLPADLRDYGTGAQILSDIGLKKIRLMTNNPRKVIGLEGYGIKIVEIIPVILPSNPYNRKYLDTKKKKLGHWL